MKHNIDSAKYEEFKEYMANKLTYETGKTYKPEDIFVGKEISLNEIMQYKFVFGDVNINSLYENSIIRSVFDLEFVYGKFIIFYNNSLQSLGGLKYVKGNFSLAGSKLSDLGELKEVENCSVLHNESLRSLKNLKRINGNLEIRNSDIESLGDLEFVHGDLIIKDCPKLKDIGKLKFVGGKIEIDESLRQLFGDKFYAGKVDGYYFRNEFEFGFEQIENIM